MSRLPTRKESPSLSISAPPPPGNPRSVSDSSYNSRESLSKSSASFKSLRSIFSGGSIKKKKVEEVSGPKPPTKKSTGMDEEEDGGLGTGAGAGGTGIVKPGWKTGESFGLGRPTSSNLDPKRAIPIPSSSSTASASPNQSPKPPSKSSFSLQDSPTIASGIPRFVSSSSPRPHTSPLATSSPQPQPQSRTLTSPSPTSAATKASYRISSDFARPPQDPPLASLRSRQPSLLLRKDRRRMSTDSGGLASNYSGQSPPPTPSKSPPTYPFPTITVPRAEALSLVTGTGTGTGSRVQSPETIAKEDRPFSPSPPPTTLVNSNGLFVPTSLGVSNGLPGTIEEGSPNPNSPTLKDDMAFRRLSINSQPSPVLSQGEAGGWGPTRKTSGSNSPRIQTPVPDPLAIATFDEIPEPVTPQQPSNGGQRGSKIPLDAPTTPDDALRHSNRCLGLSREREKRESNGTGEGEYESRERRERDRQMSVDTFNSENAPSSTQRRSRSPSRHSGNTFGQNDALAGLGGGEGPIPSTSEAFDEDTPLAMGSPSSLRRTRSALDSVRRYGGNEVNFTGERKVTPGSPVYVLNEDDFAGLYRSASARLQSSQKGRKASGDIFPTKERLGAAWTGVGDEDANGEERPMGRPLPLNIKTTSNPPVIPSSGQTSAASRQEMTSPLDDLIAGLGGRRASASSLGARTFSSMEPSNSMMDPMRSPKQHQEALEEEESLIMDESDPESPEIDQRRRLSDQFPHPPADLREEELPPSPEKPVISLQNAEEGVSTKSMSVEQMEREMARMEAELALTGRRSVVLDPPSPSIAGATGAASPNSSLNSSSPVSNYSPHLERTIRSSYPNPTPPRTLSALDRSVSQSSSNTDITPRTARRWSIVEVEMAYQRMKEMLGSTKSYLMASDQLTLGGESELGDEDVEHAFERALQDAKAQSPRDHLSSADNTPLVNSVERFNAPDHSPSSNRRSINIAPRSSNGLTDRAPKLSRSPGSSDSHDRRTGSSPATSTFHSSISHKASAESMALPLPVQILPSALNTSNAKANRRHTFNAPAQRSDMSVLDVFDSPETRSRRDSDGASRNGAMRRSNSGGVSSSSSLAPPKVSRSKTADSVKSLTSDDEGWATPMTSPGGRRSRNRLSASSALRSGAGREWAKETAKMWGADESELEELQQRATSPESLAASTYSTRSPRARPVSMDSPRRQPPPSELVTSKRASKPLVADSWYPNTPDRAGHRRLQAAQPRAAPRDDAADNMAKIRNMDKLEIFFKFTSAKADLEKAVMERDALLDALQESRTVLDDVRRQRDMLESELRREKNASKELKKVLGNDSTSYLDRIEELMRSRATWEKRARDAHETIDQEREETETLRRIILEGRDREDNLEREIIAVRNSRRESQTRRSPNAASSGVMRSPGHRQRAPTQPEGETFSPGSPSRATTAASKVAEAYRQRTPSNTSSSSGMDIAGLGELGTPLMNQKIQFGPKSSYGSVISPVKGRQPISISAQPRGSGGSRLGLGLPQAGESSATARQHSRHFSKDSTASSDFGEHLPPPVERGWDANGSTRSTNTIPDLNEEDEKFLSDLSGPIG